MSLAFCQSFKQKVTARPCAYGYLKGQGRDVEFYPPRQVLNFALYENLLSIVFSYALPYSVWLLIFFKKKYWSAFFSNERGPSSARVMTIARFEDWRNSCPPLINIPILIILTSNLHLFRRLLKLIFSAIRFFPDVFNRLRQTKPLLRFYLFLPKPHPNQPEKIRNIQKDFGFFRAVLWEKHLI